jgi:hypothetical protein
MLDLQETDNPQTLIGCTERIQLVAPECEHYWNARSLPLLLVSTRMWGSPYHAYRCDVGSGTQNGATDLTKYLPWRKRRRIITPRLKHHCPRLARSEPDQSILSVSIQFQMLGRFDVSESYS